MTIENAALQYAGRAKYSITPVSNSSDADVISDHTYSIADAAQVRHAIGWTYGADHWAFNADGTAKVLTGEAIAFYSGKRVSIGQTQSAGVMPALALSPTAPGDLRSVQTWSKVVSAREIGKL